MSVDVETEFSDVQVMDDLKRDIDDAYLTSLARIYEEALEEILAQEPGLWKTMQRIAAKALGVEYVEDA